jgi:hypothetical protein
MMAKAKPDDTESQKKRGDGLILLPIAVLLSLLHSSSNIKKILFCVLLLPSSMSL